MRRNKEKETRGSEGELGKRVGEVREVREVREGEVRISGVNKQRKL